MRLKRFSQFLNESWERDSSIIFRGGNKFDITHGELDDILSEITDEFPELSYSVENSLQSSLINEDNKSFVVILSCEGDMWDLPVLHYLETKIFGIISDIDSQLRAYDLYVSGSDFGESDAYYELVISKVGHTPEYRERYGQTLENSTATATTGGMGAVSVASVSSTSVAASQSGSGDPVSTLKVNTKRKKGNPSQVSDLRDLAPAKITRVSEINMKHLKGFKVFENNSQIHYGEVSSIIADFKTEFTDLGYDVSGIAISSYQVTEDKFIPCVIFDLSTPLETQEMLMDCYDVLDDLRRNLETRCGLDLSLEMYEDLPIMDLDDAYEVYASNEWSYIKVIIHEPIDRKEITGFD
jgi:hypothetical protein